MSALLHAPLEQGRQVALVEYEENNVSEKTYEDGKRQGYADGYMAAAETAATVRILVTAEVDDMIAVGVSGTAGILKRNAETIAASLLEEGDKG
jgi:flagellar biosynthesis/type III secretory pathway protein FliH